ncbi:MAG TPA: hypothetical protein VF702_00650 [Allosphingosinicella sp.]
MNDDLVTVMVVGALDREAQSLVEQELASAGIDCFIEGSVVYGVQVRSTDADRARQILEGLQALQDHWVEFPSG